MFSGPDFLYANAFYPNAKTYVLAGLEPVGTVPDLTTLRGSLAPNLYHLHASHQLAPVPHLLHHPPDESRICSVGRVNGTLPILYVFLARSGKTVREVTRVRLDEQGAVQPDVDGPAAMPTRGVKIVVRRQRRRAAHALLLQHQSCRRRRQEQQISAVLETLGARGQPGEERLLPAALGRLLKVRDFLLANSAAMVQDDSGIPLRYYDPKKWDLQPFGRYLGPIGVFPGRYQPNYASLFRNSRPIDFGIGYRWRPNESNLLLAVRSREIPPPKRWPSRRRKDRAPKAARRKRPPQSVVPAPANGGPGNTDRRWTGSASAGEQLLCQETRVIS